MLTFPLPLPTIGSMKTYFKIGCGRKQKAPLTGRHAFPLDGAIMRRMSSHDAKTGKVYPAMPDGLQPCFGTISKTAWYIGSLGKVAQRAPLSKHTAEYARIVHLIQHGASHTIRHNAESALFNLIVSRYTMPSNDSKRKRLLLASIRARLKRIKDM